MVAKTDKWKHGQTDQYKKDVIHIPYGDLLSGENVIIYIKNISVFFFIFLQEYINSLVYDSPEEITHEDAEAVSFVFVF